MLAFRGLKRQPIEDAEAGDIVAIAGLSKATVADTLCAMDVTEALPAQADRLRLSEAKGSQSLWPAS